MFRWLIVCGLLCGGSVYVIRLAVSQIQPQTQIVDGQTLPVSAEPGKPEANSSDVNIPSIGIVPTGLKNSSGPMAIIGARIVVVERQDVGSDRDGMIVFFGTELKPGEEKNLPAKRIISQAFTYIAVEVQYDPARPATSYPIAGTPQGEKPFMVPIYVKDPVHLTDIPNYFTLDDSGKTYTRWREGMPLYADHFRLAQEMRKFRKLEEQEHVDKGDVVALINPEQALIELNKSVNKVVTAEAERLASAKTRDEAVTRYNIMRVQDDKVRGSVQPEEMRGALLQVDRYTQEEIGKRAAVRAAEYEVQAAMKVVTMHEIRSAIPGVVKTLNKNRGDSVKANQDVLMQLVNPGVMRAEAMVEVQEARKLHRGQDVRLEASLRVTPKLTLGQARGEISAVAVSKGGQKVRYIIAASEDKTLRAWDAATGSEAWRPVRMPSPVRALACTPNKAERNLLLVGLADGTACLFDLNDSEGKPMVLPERHKGPITAVAFSTDGLRCATASDDRSIFLWSFNAEKAKWERQQAVPDAHRAAITSLAFSTRTLDVVGLPVNAEWLVSAGRDNSLTVWKSGAGQQLVRDTDFTGRSGDVSVLGADGDRVLFDFGKELRVLSLRDRQIEGTMKNSSNAASFATMALFSPDGRVVLTNGGVDGKPQLWRAPPRRFGNTDPLAAGRGSELRQLASNSAAMCGAFDPDGQFAVTGTQDGQVLVWEMPKPEELDKRIPAVVSKIDLAVDIGQQASVWVELRETPPWLVPGSTATLIVVPEE